MKKLRTLSASLIFGLALFGAGCAAIAPGNDPVVVNAQRTIKTSFDTVDTFLKLEFDARTSGAKVPVAVTDAAKSLRVKFPPAEKAAMEALSAYKQAKTDSNGDNLALSINLLRSLMSVASNAQAALTSP